MQVSNGTNYLLRHTKRVVLAVIGATLLVIGVALLVLPGPGTVVILLGLAVLAVEFAWARTLLRNVKERLTPGRNRRNAQSADQHQLSTRTEGRGEDG